uniref:Uncharacterized protein n=1 Tax=Anguilla anguilla TaxID=7936 RepID=A0A0E9PR13_ANGAN
MNIFNWDTILPLTSVFILVHLACKLHSLQTKIEFPFFLLLAKVWNLAVPRPMGEAILDKETSRCQLKKSLFMCYPLEPCVMSKHQSVEIKCSL